MEMEEREGFKKESGFMCSFEGAAIGRNRKKAGTEKESVLFLL